MVFSRNFNQWVRYNDTQEDVSDRSISSEDAIINCVDNNNDHDDNDGRIYEKKDTRNRSSSFSKLREGVDVKDMNKSFTKLMKSMKESERLSYMNESFTKLKKNMNENKQLNNMNASFANLQESIRENELNKSITSCCKKSSNSLVKYWRNNSYKKRMIIILSTVVISLLFIIIIGASIGTTRRNNNSPSSSSPITETTTLVGDEGLFDFSDIDDGSSSDIIADTITPTAMLSRIPSMVPSVVPSAQNSTEPSVAPSTSKPSNLSDYPSLTPSTTPSKSSKPSSLSSILPSDIASSNPTWIPTEQVQPVARPPVLPFVNTEDSDSITTFCVIADVPYTQIELDQLPGQIASQMDGCEFLIHLGDIFVGDTECNIEDYASIQNIMLESHVPTFVVPGDNEWNDCQRKNIDTGWNHWTDHFLEFENNWNHTFSIMRQPDYEENFYFIHKRTLFFGLNIVAGRVHNETEWKTRLQSEYLWVKDVMELNLQETETADGVILMAHAHPSEDHRQFFNAFRIFIKNELENKFPILYLHGDGHNFMYTPNFNNQSNFLRMQHEGGTNEPVLKIMAGPQRIGRRSTAYDAFQYDRQLHFLNNKQKED